MEILETRLRAEQQCAAELADEVNSQSYRHRTCSQIVTCLQNRTLKEHLAVRSDQVLRLLRSKPPHAPLPPGNRLSSFHSTTPSALQRFASSLQEPEEDTGDAVLQQHSPIHDQHNMSVASSFEVSDLSLAMNANGTSNLAHRPWGDLHDPEGDWQQQFMRGSRTDMIASPPAVLPDDDDHENSAQDDHQLR